MVFNLLLVSNCHFLPLKSEPHFLSRAQKCLKWLVLHFLSLSLDKLFPIDFIELLHWLPAPAFALCWSRGRQGSFIFIWCFTLYYGALAFSAGLLCLALVLNELGLHYIVIFCASSNSKHCFLSFKSQAMSGIVCIIRLLYFLNVILTDDLNHGYEVEYDGFPKRKEWWHS